MSAIVLSTAGVLLLSGRSAAERAAAPASWMSRGAVLGLAAGASFALASVGYRGAMLALDSATPWVSGAYGLVWAQAIQTLLLGAWLLARDREGLAKVMAAWRFLASRAWPARSPPWAGSPPTRCAAPWTCASSASSR
jgi:hypothetical protein